MAVPVRDRVMIGSRFASGDGALIKGAVSGTVFNWRRFRRTVPVGVSTIYECGALACGLLIGRIHANYSVVWYIW